MTKRRVIRRLRLATAGFTLVELLVAIAILSMISILIYSAFSNMRLNKEGIQRVSDRYREGRMAMARITRELQGAYISLHQPVDPSQQVVKTSFIGTRGTPADRVDFNAFAHVRVDRDSKESDQAEISYFGASEPKTGVNNLVRRESARIDQYPEKGGRVEVLATDIDLFDLEYLDPLTGQWSESWDTTQATGQLNRMPLQVRAILVMNEGKRGNKDKSRQPVRFVTKIPLPIQRPLTFATQ